MLDGEFVFYFYPWLSQDDDGEEIEEMPAIDLSSDSDDEVQLLQSLW